MSTIQEQIDLVEERWKAYSKDREKAQAELKNLEEGIKPDWNALDKKERYAHRLESLGQNDAAEAIRDGTAASFNRLERIIGASQLSGIAFFERGMVAARAVARVRIRNSFGMENGFGSGVMISPRLFMTNNHVIEEADVAALSVAEFGYVTSALGPRTPFPFQFKPDEFFRTDKALDYTIVAVEEQNVAGNKVIDRGWCPLIASSGKALVGERVNLIQHPSGERMQVAVRDNKIITALDQFLHYVADTQPGSSGSPVFNDQWEMAALHHAGKPREDDDGNILLTNGAVWDGSPATVQMIDWEANEGVRISSIVEHMKSAALTPAENALWKRAFEPGEPMDLWDLMEASGKEPPKKHGPFEETTDENGNPAWLFRLSFGPVGGPGVTPTPVAQSHLPAAAVAPDPKPSPSPRPGDRENARKVAESIYEQFKHSGTYYSKSADEAAAKTYWDGIDWKASAAKLYPALSDRLEAGHKRLSYAKARLEFLYPSIDLHSDGKLHNIYSGDPFDPVEAIAKEIATVMPYAASGRSEASVPSYETLLSLEMESLWERVEAESAKIPFNCEHVVCQSWFRKDGQKFAKADLHHLFACESGCNSFRSNIPYYDFGEEEEGVRSKCGRTEGRTKFEPENGKGAAARATMYFLIRYKGVIGNDPGELTKSRLEVLLDWHKAFPVDEYEKHRNWLIHEAQGNRNPFIDRPNEATEALLKIGFGSRRKRGSRRG